MIAQSVSVYGAHTRRCINGNITLLFAIPVDIWLDNVYPVVITNIKDLEMPCRLSREQIEQTISFHGHWCPGLAVGLRAAEWALTHLGRAEDEEIVSVVETDMCAVDAIQFLTGCTFGKGNLIHRDYGKNAFSFYRRRDDTAARLVKRPDIFGRTREAMNRLNRKRQARGLTVAEGDTWNKLRAEMSALIMDAEFGDLFQIKKPTLPVPEKARILESRICESCGEAVMETRTRKFEGRVFCTPCFESQA